MRTKEGDMADVVDRASERLDRCCVAIIHELGLAPAQLRELLLVQWEWLDEEPVRLGDECTEGGWE